jgi:hypothetical protein
MVHSLRPTIAGLLGAPSLAKRDGPAGQAARDSYEGHQASSDTTRLTAGIPYS